MKIQPFRDPELYLLNKWESARLLEHSMTAVRDKYGQILDAALDKLRQRYSELDHKGIHLTDEWDLNVGIGKESWPSTYPKWPSGIWLGCLTLDHLTSEDADTPFACVWYNPPKSAGIDLDRAVKRMLEAAKTILTKELPHRVKEEVLRSEANIWYPLPESRHELLEMLLNNKSSAFIDCILAHFETLAKFIPVMDEIAGGSKRKGE